MSTLQSTLRPFPSRTGSAHAMTHRRRERKSRRRGKQTRSEQGIQAWIPSRPPEPDAWPSNLGYWIAGIMPSLA
jgi:hypothetical protein